jgi:diguanylate cyclase (GGDEF)-like protein
MGNRIDPSIIPNCEDGRISALRRYSILDTPSDGAFDRITSLAAMFFKVPIAVISLVDHDRIWFKSHHGLDVNQIDREPGLCASAILQDAPYIVTNARIDPRTLTNPLVAGTFGLQFYAGVQLKTHDGYNLGMLCVIDQEPREVEDVEVSALKELAAIVTDELEIRLAARRRADQEEEARQALLKEKEHFERLAYLDTMTNVRNQFAFDQDRKVLREQYQEGLLKDVEIVTVDLDGLKQINHQKGRKQGDQALVQFAQAMTEAFKDVGRIYRLGGDVFSAVIPIAERIPGDTPLMRVTKVMNALHQKGHMSLNANFGSARYSETGMQDGAALLAEERMLAEKMKYRRILASGLS